MELHHRHPGAVALGDGAGEAHSQVGFPGPRWPVKDDLALVIEQFDDFIQDSPVSGAGRPVLVSDLPDELVSSRLCAELVLAHSGHVWASAASAQELWEAVRPADVSRKVRR